GKQVVFSMQTVYSLISMHHVPILEDAKVNIDELLAESRTQDNANYYIQTAQTEQKANHDKIIQGSLEFTLNLVPFGSAADNFTQAYQATNAEARRKFLVEGSISLAGDIATIASLGVGTTLKSGEQIASREVIRNVRLGAAVVDYGLGGVRAAQGVVAMYNGEDGAMGYFGEATLMMLGASASLIAEVKAARLAKQSVNAAQVVPGNMVSGLFGNFEYKVIDPVKASAFKQSLLDFYKKNAERPSIR